MPGRLGGGQPAVFSIAALVLLVAGASSGNELLTGERMPAFEDAAEVIGIDPAGETHLAGERADPAARCLAVAEVVVLGGGGDLTDVVAGAAGADAPDGQHEPLLCRFRRRRKLQVFERLSTVGGRDEGRRRAVRREVGAVTRCWRVERGA